MTGISAHRGGFVGQVSIDVGARIQIASFSPLPGGGKPPPIRVVVGPVFHAWAKDPAAMYSHERVDQDIFSLMGRAGGVPPEVAMLRPYARALAGAVLYAISLAPTTPMAA